MSLNHTLQCITGVDKENSILVVTQKTTRDMDPLDVFSEKKPGRKKRVEGEDNGDVEMVSNEETESKKLRIRNSAVHLHFDQVQINHPKTRKIVDGSTCKYCKTIFINRVTTNLKSHLKSKHPEAFDEVNRKV